MPQCPRIHLNGSSAGALQAGYRDVWDALTELSKAMQDAAPNARDYYVIDSGAYSRARAEHEEQMAALGRMRRHYRDLMEGLQQQIDERSAQYRGPT